MPRTTHLSLVTDDKQEAWNELRDAIYNESGSCQCTLEASLTYLRTEIDDILDMIEQNLDPDTGDKPEAAAVNAADLLRVIEYWVERNVLPSCNSEALSAYAEDYQP
jgi:hypothetical protein